MSQTCLIVMVLIVVACFAFAGTSLPPPYQNDTLLSKLFGEAKPLITGLISSGQVRGPILVRLGWHDAGTYCKYCSAPGGPHALMRLPQAADPADNGLNTARDPMMIIYNKGFNGSITLADFWQFGAVVAIEHMGGPHIPFRPGREDWEKEQLTPYDRLPDGGFAFPNFDPATKYIRDIFYRIGLNDTEIVILMGAHTLGECHAEWSGFFGPWTTNPNAFDNDYYTELINDPYTVTPGTNQYQDSRNEALMMLHVDLALIYDPVFLPLVKKYAKDEKAWFRDFSEVFPKIQEAGVTTLLPPIKW